VLKDAVDWFARDVEEIKLMLLAAAEGDAAPQRRPVRGTTSRRGGRGSPAMPLLVITLDEVQAYIERPDHPELVDEAGRAGP
jgi:hypothetical protein